MAVYVAEIVAQRISDQNVQKSLLKKELNEYLLHRPLRRQQAPVSGDVPW